MPALATTVLIQAIINAFDESGGSAVSLSAGRSNPRRFVVQFGRNMVELWVYVWTLTHGGGAARPKDEYRIQITGAKSPWELNPNGQTVLLGYEPNLGCFAGFDLAKHKTFSTKSPSIQIPITTLHEALQHGFAFTTKGNDEIAIGIRPDQLLAYCVNAELLHQQGSDAKTIGLLTKAATLETIPKLDIEQLSSERQRVVSEISRLSRDSSFRKKVLAAYDKRCAVTRMQLRLIDTAHILPVGAPNSNDAIVNGLCLSPTYHHAFDLALIYLDESLRMQINPAKEQELISLGLAGGLQEFKQYLDHKIHLPADKTQWPAIEFIHKANQFRQIPI